MTQACFEEAKYRAVAECFQLGMFNFADISELLIGAGAMIGGLEHSFGPTAVIRVDGIDVLVVSIAAQMLDLQQFRSFAIDPQKKSVVALKSMQHFRADFEPIAARVIVCDSGALCTPRYPCSNITRYRDRYSRLIPSSTLKLQKVVVTPSLIHAPKSKP